jgi:hypothetical protein
MRFYDLVSKVYDPEKHYRVLTFPETKVCEVCGNPRYARSPDGSMVDEPRLALQIRLVEFGYDGSFKNPSSPEPMPCCLLGENDPPEARSALRMEDERFMWPTLCVCAGCGGFTGYFRMEIFKNPGLAWRIALIQFGDSTCKRCDNDPPSHPCDCESRLKILAARVAGIPIESDSGWEVSGGIAIRGITDYSRRMRFSRSLTIEEEDIMREWLQVKDCPGWTGVRMIPDGLDAYRFMTTWDSSD